MPVLGLGAILYLTGISILKWYYSCDYLELKLMGLIYLSTIPFFTATISNIIIPNTKQKLLLFLHYLLVSPSASYCQISVIKAILSLTCAAAGI